MMQARKRREGPLHDPAATRGALLRGGATAFARHGFRGATADRIAAEAGVNKAMISYHFGGKRGLYEAILLSLVTDFRDRLEPLRDPSQAAADALRALPLAFLEVARKRPDVVPILVQEVLSGGSHVSGDVFPHILSVLGVTREIVERGVRSGDFRPVDPVLMHFTVIGALCFFFATERLRVRVLTRRTGIEPPTPEAFVRNLQDLIVRGLEPDAAPRRRTR